MTDPAHDQLVRLRAEIIHASLLVGALPTVEAVLYLDGGWRVRWGVDAETLDCSAHGARVLADAFEAEGLHASLRQLLRLAADVVDQKSGRRP